MSAKLISTGKNFLGRDLHGPHRQLSVSTIEFSDDGLWFVSGGVDGRVLLWPTTKALEKNWKPNPTAMETKHKISIECLAMSHHSGRIISGGLDNKLINHDSNT